MGDKKTQIDKCKEAVRGLEADEDPKHFDGRLGKLVKPKRLKKIEGGAA